MNHTSRIKFILVLMQIGIGTCTDTNNEFPPHVSTFQQIFVNLSAKPDNTVFTSFLVRIKLNTGYYRKRKYSIQVSNESFMHYCKKKMLQISLLSMTVNYHLYMPHSSFSTLLRRKYEYQSYTEHVIIYYS